MERNIIPWLKTKLTTIDIYNQAPPETCTKPCLQVTDVANNNDRTREGNKTKKSLVRRITIYAESDASLSSVLDSIEALDNTKDETFQRIFSQYVLTESRQPDVNYVRAFYDLTLYP